MLHSVLGMPEHPSGPSNSPPKPQSRETKNERSCAYEWKKRTWSEYLDDDIPLGKVAKQIENELKKQKRSGTWQEVEPQESRAALKAMQDNYDEFDVKDAGGDTVTMVAWHGQQYWRLRIPYAGMEVHKFVPHENA